MDQKTLSVLEFDKVREQLANYTAFALGRERARWLEPLSDIQLIEERQAETAEALALVDREGGLPLGGIVDIREPLRKAMLGSILVPQELLDIASTLYGTGQARKFLLQKAQEGSRLVSLAQRLVEAPQLREEIERCIGQEGEILDSASPALRSIRRRIRSLQGHIRDKLESIVHSPRYQRALQDAIITIRNGRYVLPVKADYKGLVKGIVHDQSSSGATLFIEPAAVVEINNQLRQLEGEEKEEIEKILRYLTGQVSTRAQELLISLEVLGRLDCIFAKAYLAEAQKAVRPQLRSDGYVDIKEGRHPLLKGEVVPLNVWLGRDFTTLVITGPNTGGKTVALKTVGLLTLMAQAGLHVPAREGTQINVFKKIYADIGDEQSIEQSLSTFSSHMSNIVRILDEADSSTLVLLDELGAGTDPSEGAALAMALLRWLHEHGCRTIATTHYSELKIFAYMTEGLENASVEFDIETLRPTYRLEIGLPGRSNAFAIASRLGLRPEVINQAREYLTKDEIKIDDMIQDMEENRRKSAHERTLAERLRSQVEAERERYERCLAELERAKEELLEAARQEAAEIVRQARREADALLGRLRSADKGEREDIARKVRARLFEKQEELSQTRTRKAPSVPPTEKEKIQAGDAVYLDKFRQSGKVLELTAGGSQALVQVGAMRITLPVEELSKQEDTTATQRRSETTSRLQLNKTAAVRGELDLRGLTVEEALARVDKYLDDALLAGLSRCHIIHGKGTGALRAAIRSQLAAHPQVKAYHVGGPGEGGDGVTVAELG